MVECAFDLALEGISRIRKCSPEGRLAMTLDVFDLNAGLNRVKNNPSSSSSSTSTSTSTSNNAQEINSPSDKANNNDKNKTKNKDKDKDKQGKETGKEKEIIKNDSSSSSSTSNNGNKKTVESSGVGVEKGGERGSASRGPVTIRRGKEHVDQYIQATYLLDEGTYVRFSTMSDLITYSFILSFSEPEQPPFLSLHPLALPFPYPTLRYVTLHYLT